MLFLRYAGGRNILGSSVKLGLKGGIKRSYYRGFLTTKGDAILEDIKMIENLGFSV